MSTVFDDIIRIQNELKKYDYPQPKAIIVTRLCPLGKTMELNRHHELYLAINPVDLDKLLESFIAVPNDSPFPIPNVAGIDLIEDEKLASEIIYEALFNRPLERVWDYQPISPMP